MTDAVSYTEKSLSFFSQGFHCSQSVLAAFAPEFGMDEKTALKLGGCFGCGMCAGEVCGAVVGGLMVIGLAFGHSSADAVTQKQAVNDMTREFLARFADAHQTILCRELLAHDVRDPAGLQKVREEKLFTTRCPAFVKTATEITAAMLAERRK